MSNSKCEKTMDKFLEMDKNDRIPFGVTMHLLFCKDCRRQVHYLTMAEKLAAAPLKVPAPLNDAALNQIMKSADPSWCDKNLQKNPVSMFRWILGGLLMILFLCCFGLFANSVQSEGLLITFYVVFSVIVVCYSAIFVGSNLDFFVKKIETLKT